MPYDISDQMMFLIFANVLAPSSSIANSHCQMRAHVIAILLIVHKMVPWPRFFSVEGKGDGKRINQIAHVFLMKRAYDL